MLDIIVFINILIQANINALHLIIMLIILLESWLLLILVAARDSASICMCRIVMNVLWVRSVWIRQVQISVFLLHYLTRSAEMKTIFAKIRILEILLFVCRDSVLKLINASF